MFGGAREMGEMGSGYMKTGARFQRRRREVAVGAERLKGGCPDVVGEVQVGF
jgi:hypothetical protein